MSERIKYTLKQLKRPDKFRQYAIELLEKSPQYFNKILYGTVIVILALVALYIVHVNKQANTNEANAIFQDAMSHYNSGQIEQALTTFSELNEKYPGQKSAELGIYYTGIINYEIGNYEESAESLTKYLNQGHDDALLKQSALFTIGLSHFNLGNWDQSIESLTELENQQSPYERKALLHIGLAYEKKGEYDRSEEYFKKVLEKEAARSQRSRPPVLQ